MKTLHLSIISVLLVILSVFNVNHVLGQSASVSGEVWFMKSNSVAHLNVMWSRNPPDNEIINVEKQIYTSLPDVTPVTTSDLTMTANPSSVNLNTTTRVTYTITANNNLKGIYAINRDMVTGCGLIPVVIGLNESEVDPSTLSKFFTAVYTCPAVPPTSAEQISSDGIVDKNVSVEIRNLSIPNNAVSEYPIAIGVLLIGIASSVVLYRLNFRK